MTSSSVLPIVYEWLEWVQWMNNGQGGFLPHTEVIWPTDTNLVMFGTGHQLGCGCSMCGYPATK